MTTDTTVSWSGAPWRVIERDDGFARLERVRPVSFGPDTLTVDVALLDFSGP